VPDFLRKLLSPPVFADPRKSHVAGLVNAIQVVFLGSLVAWTLVAAFHGTGVAPHFWLYLVSLFAVILISRVMTVRGALKPAAALLSLSIWGLATASAAEIGVTGVTALVFSVSTLLMALSVGARGALLTSGASLAMLTFLSLLQQAGTVPTTVPALPRDYGTYLFSLLLTLTVLFALIVWSSSLQQRSYAQVRRSQRRFQRLLEDSPDAIMLLETDGTVLSGNAELSRITGFDAEVFEGRPLQDAPMFGAATCETLLEKLKATDQGEEGAPFFEVELAHEDGSHSLAEVKVRRVEPMSGDPVCYMVNLRDIRARKRVEAQLREAAKMETVGRLAGGVAHDFNNLLQTILTCTELLDGSELNESDQEDVDAIRSAAKRGADLVQKLSAFGRRQALSPSRVDLNRLVDELREPLGRMLGDDIELVTMLDAEPMIIEADPSQLEQVLVNLALNAREAMVGGGRISFETGLVGVEEELYAGPGPTPGLYVALRVRDTGPGIPIEIRDKVFDPFFTTRRGGSGLGLSSAHGILAQSGGTIRIRDNDTGGACVELLLPAAAWSATPTPTPVGLSEESANILLVEDRPDVRAATRQLLIKVGFTVLDAESAEDARNLWMDGAQVDCLLTDVVMPVENGVVLATSLREAGYEGAVVFMSGYADRSILDEAALTGAWFIAKPFTRDSMLSTLSSALESLHPRAIG